MPQRPAAPLTCVACAAPLTCVACAAPFTLTPHAYQRHCVRYGTHLLCPRCLADSWLRSQHGRTAQENILRDDSTSPDPADHVHAPIP